MSTHGLVRRLASFSAVGAFTTALYALVAWTLAAGVGLAAGLASLVGCVVAASCSYFANRRLTFQSDLPHARVAPRYILSIGFGMVLATLTPYLLTDVMRWPLELSLAIASILTPASNFLTMNFFAFAAPSRRALSAEETS